MQNTNLVQRAFTSPNTFDQRNSKRIQLIGLMRLVHYIQWYTKSHSLKVSHFLLQCNDLWHKINFQLQNISTTDLKQKTGEQKISF